MENTNIVQNVSLVTIDHYMSNPADGFDSLYSEFWGTQILKVPVLRVFGCTPNGEKCCLHVHGVFPYIFIPLEESYETKNQEILYNFGNSLDKALSLAIGSTNSKSKHIHNIITVCGKSFYGYHTENTKFLKILFYNPYSAKIAVDLLQNGAVCNTIFQPHEAHIPYHLQFMIDYNLHGMNYIKLSAVKYRNSVEQGLSKMSRCTNEMDVQAIQILNPILINGELENSGLVNIREQINKLSTDLNITRKGLEVFSGERKLTVPSSTEIEFGIELKKKIKEIKKKNVIIKTSTELEISVNEELVINLSQVFQSQTSWDSQSIDLMNLLMKETIASKNEDSILCHNISNEDGNDSENEEFSISMMQLNENLSQNAENTNISNQTQIKDVSIKSNFDVDNFSLHSSDNDQTFMVNNNDEETNSNQTSDMFRSSNSSVEMYDSNTLNYASFTDVDDNTSISRTLWTLSFKPPSYNDSLNFIDTFKNTRYNKQFQFQNNNVIENIRKDLLSLSFPVINDTRFFASESSIILEPLKQPPSYLLALKWLDTRYPKYKRKKKNADSNKRKGLITPDSLSKSILLKKINLVTPSSSQNKFCTSSPYTPKQVMNKCLKSKRKLSTLFLDSLNADSSNDSRTEFFNSIRTTNSSDSNILDGIHIGQSSHNFCIDSDITKNSDNLTIITMELHTQTRINMNPDPEYDCIQGIFYTIFNMSENSSRTGSILVNQINNNFNGFSNFKPEIIVCNDEIELVNTFFQLVNNWDPEVICGYEMEMHSWGYLKDRCRHLGRNMNKELSRLTIENEQSSEYNEEITNSELKIKGRIVLDVWRLLRHELAVQSYTFENMVYLILHQRVPNYSYQTLSFWWDHNTLLYRWLTMDYYLFKVESTINILQQLDIIGRTSELAKLFGIQFYEVLSRGSQFRVESMMLRLAKNKNYVAVSPSIKQRAEMNAAQSVPLIMEPESKFYTDPVIVLDFQSLYPSIIIAYNYCFSTCLGNIDLLGKTEVFKFGCTKLNVPFQTLLKLTDDMTISPSGVAFVKKNICKGILPSMLQEILDTRIMVKNLMKEQKNNKHLCKILNAQQLGLKLIANVTYGYTSANFSGRMPCIEVGDSVVSKGRETLERAITLIQSTKKWNAKVIYGDTDSIFVLLQGRSKEEAFKIGNEMADIVTKDNPIPIKLKFEKVYLPCILQTKKRYCGYMYENIEQKKPKYEAKGIETVRRDGCPAVSKILEKSLCILFETKDIAAVKCYIDKQFKKIFKGNVNIQDFLFAKEYRGRNNYRPGACVPALELAKQWTAVDRRAEPRVKERVPYLIIAGPKGLPLIKLVRSPKHFISDKSARINAEYYITRAIIPPLQRCFSLLNVDINKWYSELPRKYNFHFPDITTTTNRKQTLSQYFFSQNCILCSKLSQHGFCEQCQQNPQYLIVQLNHLLSKWTKKQDDLETICRSCCGRNFELKCNSLNCQIYYGAQQAAKDMQQYSYINNIRQNLSL
ncbi:DNA polymerase zeta catalytic subunit [Acyrthosiphon pisum]|uniref:DNA polymerase n=1 Tax=Acyrthosiphon pisum TaxID=7029 RepID=A0A8R2AAL2_ACYPI|nr:DNA polymerase zeta catalytic subunit [Acyrthosiphon pisum]|eukprot:XP_001949189.2 PREDICTED: DNA polymerase zeta catalytic subunit [Acyrthosiphon pisum]